MFNEDQVNAIKSHLRRLGVEYCQNGRVYTRLEGSSKISLFIKNKATQLSFSKSIPEVRDLLLELDDLQFFEAISNILLSMTKEVKEVTSDLVDKDLRSLLMGLIPIYDVESEDRVVLYSPITREITKYNFKIWLTITGNKLSDMKGSIPVAKFRFNPYNLEPTYYEMDKSGLNILYLNQYNPPKWRFKKVEAKIPTIIDEFLTHLFPNPEAKEYALHWLHNMILKRNQTYLCLVGARGVGKGIFSEELAGALVGRRYFDKVGDSILIDKFNGPLKDKRLIVLDEVDLDDNSKIARLKSFANDMIPIESKGRDSQIEDNYNSFIIATNSLDGMSFGPEERRFSIPEITEENLANVWSSEKIEELITILKDEESEELAQFGNWLIEHGAIKNKNEFYCFKGEYYFEILRTSMKEWQKFLVDKLTSKESREYFVKDLSKEFKKHIKDNSDEFSANRAYFPRADNSSLNVFLKGYLHLGKQRIGKLDKIYDEEKGREEWAIIPSAEFMPERTFKEVLGPKNKDELGF